MADWRAIRSRRWRDKDFVRLSRDARLLEIGMTSMADDDGYLDDGLGGICASVYPRDLNVTEGMVAAWLQELIDHEFVQLYVVDGDMIFYLTRFEDEQPIRRDRRKSSKLGKLAAGKEAVKSVAEASGCQVSTDGCHMTTTGCQVTTNVEPQGVKHGLVDGCQPLVDNCQPLVVTEQTRLERAFSISLATNTKSSADADQDQSVGNPKPERSTAQLLNDEDLEDVKAAWVRRFPKFPIHYPMAQKVIRAAKEFGMDPRLLMAKVDLRAKDPMAYLNSLTDSADNPPHLEDGEHRQYSWDAWDSRPRKHPKLKGPQTLGSILPNIRLRT